MPQHELKNAYIGEYNPFDDYQEVAYIQSSGTQHIDTLHKHTADTKFEIKFNYQTQSWTWNMICGSRSNYNTSDCMNLYLHNSNRIAYGVWWKYSDNFYSSSIDTDYTISLSKTNITINWSSTSLSTSLTNYSYNDWIFWVNTNNSQVEQKVKMKLYYFKIYEWATLVRDFIPCYNKTSWDIWLRDKVEEKFYANAWTWTFTKWPDIEEREPDASRTLLYLKLENNVTDSSWNSVSVSSSWISYWTAGDKYYAQLTSTTGYIRPTATLAQQIWTWDFTVSFFMYLVSNSTWEASWMFWDWYDSWSPRPWICIRCYTDWDFAWMDDWNGANQVKVPCSKNTWHYQTYVRKNWVCYCYLDGAFIWQHNHSWNLASPWVNKFYILNRSDYSPQRWSSTWARISEVIFENVAWTADDVQNYYNNTKWNYGL